MKCSTNLTRRVFIGLIYSPRVSMYVDSVKILPYFTVLKYKNALGRFKAICYLFEIVTLSSIKGLCLLCMFGYF